MNDKQYFIDRIILDTKTGCWNWALYKDKDGYGGMKRKGKIYRAHRKSWITFKGEIPEGLHVLHHCDNPKCINPDHLYIGTHQDNMDDMVKRGRQKTIPQYGNNFRGKKILADGILYRSYCEAGKALNISDNGVRKRITLGWEGYKKY